MSSWLPKANWHYPQFCGNEVCANACTFEEKEKEQEKQYNKSKSRLRLRNKLDKEILNEQLNCHLFELEQRREMERIKLQKRKDEHNQEEEHKRLLGKQAFKAYTDKMKKLRNSWMYRMSEDEDGKLINLEEKGEEVEDRMGEVNDWV